MVQMSEDGHGGADPVLGTGLRGLALGIAALDGTLTVENSSPQAIYILAEIPGSQSRSSRGRASRTTRHSAPEPGCPRRANV